MVVILIYDIYFGMLMFVDVFVGRLTSSCKFYANFNVIFVQVYDVTKKIQMLKMYIFISLLFYILSSQR